jgi:hypothetical protein
MPASELAQGPERLVPATDAALAGIGSLRLAPR